jgi:hypothetical protein
MRRTLFLLVLSFVLAPALSMADSVVPSDRVQSHLRIRSTASGPVIGSLRPGQSVQHLATQGEWHQVELSDGRVGFVSAAWSQIIREVEPVTSAHLEVVEPVGIGSKVRGVFHRVAGWLGAPPRVDLVLRDPVHDGAVHEHDDPVLPVAGLATPEGTSGTYDLVLALDASTSTHAFSLADVNEDGRLEDRWRGPDSIYHAQLRAAREFVAALSSIPHNRGGERIRVGLVSFAGDEDATGETFEASPKALLELAQLDAKLHVPVTSDYARLDRTLEELASHEPEGATDFAAGIGSAMAALGVLTSGPASEGPNGEAQRAILFLTDGKPRLPVERETAQLAALYASSLARDAGVRIHTFALGRDTVRRDREVNPVVARMARRTGGHFTQLEEPGDIVGLLSSTSFSFVSTVRLANSTRGDEIPEIATAIDGSFYGELPLAEGVNEIEVEAVLNDGRKATRKLQVTWVDTKPIKALERKLTALREDNAVLVEQLRKKLVRQMKTAKRKEERDVRIWTSE